MSKQRLLVIDDEPRFARFIENVALDLGFDVTVTNDYRAFMKAYEETNPSTIVLDMVMPTKDGNDLILWLAERHSTAALIIVTGYTPDYASNAKTLAEFKGFKSVNTLHKPVDIEDLRAALQAAGGD